MALNKPEIGTIMTVSTAHLTPNTLKRLETADMYDSTFANIACYPKILDGENIGWFIYPCIPSSQIHEDIPEDLKAILDLAEFCNASVICLDSDGPIVDRFLGLKAYPH
ncbi:MAG: hypothetical protein HDQ88_08805 [Clostridia bacterium]|nr:hypothetical protein [Clostridia bacterium]